MTPQDKPGPTFDDLGESPVLSKLDALIRRHRPAGVGAPILTEQVNKPPRIGAGFPQLIDPDPHPVQPSAAEPILTFDFPPMEEPPLLLEIDDLDEEMETSNQSHPAVEPITSPAEILPIEDAEATPITSLLLRPAEEVAPTKSAATLYWEEEATTKPTVPAEDGYQKVLAPEPITAEEVARPAIVSSIPDLSMDSIPVLEVPLHEPDSNSFDTAPLTPPPPPSPAAVDDTEAALAQPISSLMDAILQAPSISETPPPIEPHDEVPVLTELALEYDDQLLPLLDATSRAEWVAEMVDDIIKEITPKIRGLVRAQLGLQIGSLMKTVTDEVSKQLQESWRKELKRKIEKRVIEEVDANLHQHIIGQLPPDSLASSEE